MAEAHTRHAGQADENCPRHNPGREEQVPLLRRGARAEGQGDVLAPGLAVRPRQRRDEFRASPHLEAADRGDRRGGDARGKPMARPLLRHRRHVFPRRKGRREGDARRRRGFHLADARGRAAAQGRRARVVRVCAGGRPSPPLPGRDVRPDHRRLRAAQPRGPGGGPGRDAPRPRAGRPRGHPRFRETRQPRRRRALQRVPPHDDAGRRLALPRRRGDLPLHPGLPRAVSRPARRRRPDAQRPASPTSGSKSASSVPWASTSARHRSSCQSSVISLQFKARTAD